MKNKLLKLISTTTVFIPSIGLTGCVVETGGDTPQSVHTITLYAGEGSFPDQSTDILTIAVKGNNTTIDDAIGSIEPIGPSGAKFQYWVDGKGMPAVKGKLVTSDMSFKAKYEETVDEYKAYVVQSGDEQISLSTTAVQAKTQFSTTVTRTGGDLKPDNVSCLYIAGELVKPGASGLTIQQGENPNQIEITINGALTNGDVVIVVTFESSVYHSYICNDPSDGLVLTESEIQPGVALVGVVTAPIDINGNWEIEKVLVKGKDATNNFQLVIDESKPKQASILFNKSSAIDGDVFIWFKSVNKHVDFNFDMNPFEMEIPEAGTPAEDALNSYYDFVKLDKTNLFKDICNSIWYDRRQILSLDVGFDIYDLGIEQNKNGIKVITVDYDIDASYLFHSATERFDYSGEVRGIRYELQKSEDNKSYILGTHISKMNDPTQLRQSLGDSSHPWSIVGTSPTGSVIAYSDAYVRSLSEDEWNAQYPIIKVNYGWYACFNHGYEVKCNYLKNIVLP